MMRKCSQGHETNFYRDCPVCRAETPRVRRGRRIKPVPVQLSPEKRIHARIVAERLLAKAGRVF